MRYTRIGPVEMAVLAGEEEVVAAPPGGGPAVGDGLLLELDTDGTSFLKLETNDFLLLEG